MLRSILLVASVALVMATARPPTGAFAQLDGPALPSAALVAMLMPGNRELAADYFWIRLTNAAGSAYTPEEYRQLIDYAELIADLSPRFKEVYEFAGAIIPFNLGRDTWVNGDEAMRIVKRGLEQYPDDPTLRGYLVFNLIYLERDYKAAAEILRQMSMVPGAPPHLAQLATRLYAQAGEFDAGLEFSRALAAGAQTEEQRRFFEQRVKQIESEQILALVDAAAWDFFRREGRHAATVAELLASGDLKKPPLDPLGGQIHIDSFGRARTTASEFRLELFEDSTKSLTRTPIAP